MSVPLDHAEETIMRHIALSMIGGGFSAHLHGRCFQQLAGVDLRLRGIATTRLSTAEPIAKLYGYEYCTDHYEQLLEDPETDVIFVNTPPALHTRMILQALEAGKHVICEKPLTGYFGTPEDGEAVGDTVGKEKMYHSVLRDLERIGDAIARSGKQFMYAENYIYAPNIQKAAEIIRARASTTLFMRGELMVQGSPSKFSGVWKNAGGGCLMRIGCHPLGGMLWLKRMESEAKGATIRPVSVMAETGRLSTGLSDWDSRHLKADPQDVEDFAAMTMTFSDQTKAMVVVNDNALGGLRNRIDIFANDGTMLCRITPNDYMDSFFLDDYGLDHIYLAEKLENKLGWNSIAAAENITRGYAPQLQDFIECVADDRPPLSDFSLAAEVTRLIYAGYLSAERGMRIELDELC